MVVSTLAWRAMPLQRWLFQRAAQRDGSIDFSGTTEPFPDPARDTDSDATQPGSFTGSGACHDRVLAGAGLTVY